MDLMINSKVLETVEGGVLLEVSADDLHVQAFVVVAPVDMEIVERLVPISVFESGVQIHVSGVNTESDVVEQIVQILENMDQNDVVVFLCENTIAYGESLATLGLKH